MAGSSSRLFRGMRTCSMGVSCRPGEDSNLWRIVANVVRFLPAGRRKQAHFCNRPFLIRSTFTFQRSNKVQETTARLAFPTSHYLIFSSFAGGSRQSFWLGCVITLGY